MDESHSTQLKLDFRTGRPTTINGRHVSDSERAACSAINRERVLGISQISQFSPSRESIPADVWAATFIRKTREWDVPLISLNRLGLIDDDDGLRASLESNPLGQLRSGAEAYPFVDRDAGVVYKLFYLLENGALGKKINYSLNEEGEFEVRIGDAVLADTLIKLSVLHGMGAHPTEIVGLSDTGTYLIVKQPLASPFENFESDQKEAIGRILGVPLSCQGIRGNVIVSWFEGQAWLVSDLHVGNIMRDGENKPCIIDALVGLVPPKAYNELSSP